MREKTKKSKEIFSCSFMTLFEDDVTLENGFETKRVYIKHPGAAAVLPITKDKRIILTKQFRYPIKNISIEIPAGKKDSPEENSESCARRELEEETGYISNDIRHLYAFYTCLGYSDEVIDLYVAYDCEKIDHPKSQDVDEYVETMILSHEKVKEMLENQDIKDGKTIMALQKYFLIHENK